MPVNAISPFIIQPDIHGAYRMPFHVILWHIATLCEAISPHGASRCPFKGTRRHIAALRDFRVAASAGDVPVKADAFAANQPYRPFGLPTWQAFRPNRHFFSRTHRKANQSPRHFCKCVRKRWVLPRNRLSIRYMRIGLCSIWDIDSKPMH